ncbi:MAG: glycosyltransferase, partial [Chromatiales bacterium]|nr:glycosyltransferase [Chromatiales bacterium]
MPDTHADAPLRLVFAHDHRFVRDGDRYLSAGQFNANTWQRYLDICDELVVVAREGKIQSGMQTGDYNVASRPAVSFRFVPDLAGAGAFLLHRQAARRIMHAEVANADGVIARLPSETGLLAIEVARQQHKPWAVEVVGCAWDALWNYGNLQGKLYAPVMSRRMRQAVARAPFATYVTQSFLQHRYPCEAGIVSACSDVDLAPPRTDVLTARLARACETDRKAVVFGLIGTLKGRYKGIQTAIAALAQIRSWHPDCRLRILGSGDPEPWRRLAQGFGIADAVTFDGVLPSGEPVLDWLDEIDVYLQPSLQEGLPR